MANARSTGKARPERNPPPKTRTRPKSEKHSNTPAKRRKALSAGGAKARAIGPAISDKQAPPMAESGARIRVRGRLQQMVQAELFNLERAESVLRCLMFAMEFTDLTTKGVAYFPDVVEVAADLVRRSIVDLDELYDGRISDPLMATLKAER